MSGEPDRIAAIQHRIADALPPGTGVNQIINDDVAWLIDQLQPLGWETGLPINDFGRRCYAAGKAFNEFTAFHAHNGMMDALAERDKAQAALLTLQRQVGQEWRPISTAPKEQRVLVVLKPHPGQEEGEITFAYFVMTLPGQSDGIWTYDESGEQCVPTHWIQLPSVAALLPSLAEKEPEHEV